MKTKSIIKAAQKAGLKVTDLNGKVLFESDTVEGSIYDQAGEAMALRTIRKDEKHEHKPEHDERRDYFHYSVKSFISSFAY